MQVSIGGFPIITPDPSLALDPLLVLMVHSATTLRASGLSEHAAVQSVFKIYDMACQRLEAVNNGENDA
jgi:hypothetical protein